MIIQLFIQYDNSMRIRKWATLKFLCVTQEVLIIILFAACLRYPGAKIIDHQSCHYSGS